MNKLNSAQRNKLLELKNIVGTGCPEKDLIALLGKHKYDTNSACEEYFSSDMESKYANQSASLSKIKTLFSKYSSDGKMIDGEGIEQLFIDLEVDMEDPVTLLISFYMQAKTQGQYTSEEFKRGCARIGVDDITAWKRKLQDLRNSLKNDAALFKQVYNFTFDFSQEPGLKNIDVELAIALWRILLAGKCQFLDSWIKFIEESGVKIVKKDQWQNLHELCIATGGDFSVFQDDGCWASQIDEYVEYMKKK